MTKVACENCTWIGLSDRCKPIQKLSERVAPGEIMPYGECPGCGAVCHEYTGDKPVSSLKLEVTVERITYSDHRFTVIIPPDDDEGDGWDEDMIRQAAMDMACDHVYDRSEEYDVEYKVGDVHLDEARP